MQSLFISVKCDRGQTYTVGRRILKEVPHVKEVSSISGKWDLLVQLRVPPGVDMGELINEKIAGIEGIRRTKTQIAYFVYNREDVFF
jgi:DNA-binding Lrp family transcriptional regulator